VNGGIPLSPKGDSLLPPLSVKAAFSRANRLLEKVGFPPLEVGDRQEADNFLRRYMSTQFTTPLCSVRFQGKPIAVYAFNDYFHSTVYTIPFHNISYIQPDYRTETGFALAWKALAEYFIWRKDIFAVAVKLHSAPHSPTRAYTLEIVPTPIMGKFWLTAFYDLEKDSFKIIFDIFDRTGVRISQKSAQNDFSAVRECLLYPLALLHL
jgi:hypothetical protein